MPDLAAKWIWSNGSWATEASVCCWLLTAGEIYTTFTFLGAGGWAYSKGEPFCTSSRTSP
jgi:Na+/proline symporter